MIVVDASVAAKLVLDEADSDLAERWYLDLDAGAVAPDLIAIEVAQGIVRRVNMRLATPEQGRHGLAAWHELMAVGGFELHRTTPGEVMTAADLAIRLGHPVKDCVYLALAMARGATLVTADARFAERARSAYDGVRLLAELGD